MERSITFNEMMASMKTLESLEAHADKQAVRFRAGVCKAREAEHLRQLRVLLNVVKQAKGSNPS